MIAPFSLKFDQNVPICDRVGLPLAILNVALLASLYSKSVSPIDGCGTTVMYLTYKIGDRPGKSVG